MKAKKEKLLGNFVHAGEVEIPKSESLEAQCRIKSQLICASSIQSSQEITH